jgi:hypothetical protein
MATDPEKVTEFFYVQGDLARYDEVCLTTVVAETQPVGIRNCATCCNCRYHSGRRN